MQHKILIIEDEPELLMVLRDNLAFEKYEVHCAATGEAGMELAFRDPPHLVLLDVMLPGMSGYDVCQRLRWKGISVPIIMLTARHSESDRITGLDLGANDYVAKPFSVRELLARVRAQLRQVDATERTPLDPATASQKSRQITCGDLVIDINTRSVLRESESFRLSPHEFDLLLYLFSHASEVVSRQELLCSVWGYNPEATSRTVDNFVAKLRRKIERDPDNPKIIITLHRVGYQFVVPAESKPQNHEH